MAAKTALGAGLLVGAGVAAVAGLLPNGSEAGAVLAAAAVSGTRDSSADALPTGHAVFTPSPHIHSERCVYFDRLLPFSAPEPPQTLSQHRVMALDLHSLKDSAALGVALWPLLGPLIEIAQFSKLSASEIEDKVRVKRPIQVTPPPVPGGHPPKL